MKLLKILRVLIFLLAMPLYGQENAASTPEYEATRQTEKLQQELNLSGEQIKLVYEINLKYARARQSSTTRSEAMQRVKNKDADLEKVLRKDQINKLRTKRYERSVYQPPQSENQKAGEAPQRVSPPPQRTAVPQMRTRQSGQEQPQTRQNDEIRRKTQPEPARGEPAFPSRNERTVRPSVGTQPQTPVRREQSSPPVQRRETPPAKTPPSSTESRRR